MTEEKTETTETTQTTTETTVPVAPGQETLEDKLEHAEQAQEVADDAATDAATEALTAETDALTRADVVAALATVPGLSASQTAPEVITAGAAWPVWASSTWRSSCYWETRWYVFVALENGSSEATVESGDPLVDQVGQALAAAGLGGLVVEPWSWSMDENRSRTAPVLRFTAID